MALIEKGRSRFTGSAQSVLIDRVSETITGVTTFFVASCGYPQRVACLCVPHADRLLSVARLSFTEVV